MLTYTQERVLKLLDLVEAEWREDIPTAIGVQIAYVRRLAGMISSEPLLKLLLMPQCKSVGESRPYAAIKNCRDFADLAAMTYRHLIDLGNRDQEIEDYLRGFEPGGISDFRRMAALPLIRYCKMRILQATDILPYLARLRADICRFPPLESSDVKWQEAHWVRYASRRLFDYGLDRPPLAEVTLGCGRMDLLLIEPTQRPAPIEFKWIEPTASRRICADKVSSGLHQARTYASELPERTAYLFIINETEFMLEIGGAEALGPNIYAIPCSPSTFVVIASPRLASPSKFSNDSVVRLELP